MRKILKTMIYLLLLIFLSTTLMAGRLSDFKDDLKDSDSSTSDNSNSDNSTSSSKSDKSSTSSDNYFDEDDYKFLGGLFAPIFRRHFRYKASQTYAQYPYQQPAVPYNLHVSKNRKTPAGRKRWTLATTVEYQRFDDELNAIVLDLDFTFAGFLRLKISSNSLQEQMFNYKDSLTFFNFMFGEDIFTYDNFIMGFRLGIQKVTDLDKNMFAYNFYMQAHLGKPAILDIQYTGAIYNHKTTDGNEVTTKEFKARLGFLVSMYDFGIGYSWLKLNNAEPMNAINLSVRFWM